MKRILLFLSVFLSATLFGQNVYVPDANFKACLVGNSEINTNDDTEIQVSEASVFNGAIYCWNQNISDLTGIEAFTALTYLDCSLNQLTSLDLSQNTALSLLECSNNELTSLDVSQNTALEYLNCSLNQLTSLDVTQNTALEYLYCNYNQLTNLDVSQNTALTELQCGFNQLTSLDVSQNTALTVLYCGYNQLTNLDVSQNTALTLLLCHHNQLTSLDFSQNTALGYLKCIYNQLTSLDVSHNTALTELYCSYNQLTNLDVSQNTALEYLDCNYNQLTCLNVANGNNTDMSSELIEYAIGCGNPNLTCIEVDDETWATDNWTNIDPQTSFSEDCNNDCTSSLTQLNTSKNLIQILDMMGCETSFKPNTPLIYVYDDGSIEKVFTIE